jgi:hypothetical protein
MESGSRPGDAEEVDGWWYGFEWGTVGVISVVGCAKVVVVVVVVCLGGVVVKHVRMLLVAIMIVNT